MDLVWQHQQIASTMDSKDNVVEHYRWHPVGAVEDPDAVFGAEGGLFCIQPIESAGADDDPPKPPKLGKAEVVRFKPGKTKRETVA